MAGKTTRRLDVLSMSFIPANPKPVLLDAMRRAEIELPNLVLVDVGCSGGIDPGWRPYDAVLRAVGIDPLVNEIERLKREDTRPNVEYHAAFASGPPLKEGRGTYQGWFDRVSALAAHSLLRIDYTNQVYNSDLERALSDRRVSVDALRIECGIDRVDFLKSDTDGHDYTVLQGAEKTLETVLGVMVEATFATEGGGSVFRDIDAYMDARGFCLVGVQPVVYTRAALPGRFNHPFMMDTTAGACSWGDFLYLRDIVKHGPHDLQTALRLSLIAELFNLPDVAAEALVAVQAEAREQIEMLLDALVPYSGRPDAGSYQDLMRQFKDNPRAFAPAG